MNRHYNKETSLKNPYIAKQQIFNIFVFDFAGR